MKKVWNEWLKESVFMYCVIYTIATLVNSVAYLINGSYSDPNGNWHEIDRGLIVLIGVLACKMATKLPIKNTLVRMIVTYIPTMLLTFFIFGLLVLESHFLHQHFGIYL